ncbi:MAG TPA: zf-HC2 domain-containing protein [Candidatus Angelobacter sp.]|nr:zf-HC2 domain-containing protein [Candidatus Angelobacter sp.]
MNNEYPNRLECSEFEALLAEALDGALSAETRESFEAHGRSCRVCGPQWSEALEGLELMRSLGEAEPPKNLVHNILAATSMKQAQASSVAAPVKGGWLDRLRAGWRPSFAGLMHSRFATSFAMAFFSLSLTLTLAGVKISDVRNVDWHPSALRKSMVLGFTQVEAKVTSYYENMRLVYEVQARVRELRKTAAPASGTGNENKQQNRITAPDDGGRPQQQENYSREVDGTLMAQFPAKHQGAQL